MGHEIAVTPLQMLMAMNTIANRRADEADDCEERRQRRWRDRIAISAAGGRAGDHAHTSDLMTTALRKVVGPDGTAPKAAVEGFDVAGKTGTAQKVENGQYVRKYYSTFIGYFPASNPEISILVSLDDPTGGAFYGGSVAGPVFRAVAEKVAEYLGMVPQAPPTEVTKVS
jgi:cell division protein FtsI (penicillin-binding protein 3)